METVTRSSGAVFVDASALYALVDRRDQNASSAGIAYLDLIRTRAPLVTSNLVLGEYHALMVRRLGSYAASVALETITDSDVNTVVANEVDHARALDVILRDRSTGYSLADATSFAIMARLNIEIAFSFDMHFQLFGFRTIPG